MTRFTTFALIVGLTAGLAGTAMAETIVSWGPATDIVTGQQGTIGGEGSSSIDFGTPSNPTIGASYYPNNAGKSPVFYFASTATAGNLDVRILDNGTNNDEFRMAMNDNSGDPRVVDGAIAIVWTKDGDGSNFGFLNGGDANPVTLTSISTTFNDNGSANRASVDRRWIIRLGSDFYVSEAFDYTSNMSLADPSTANWFSYDPATDIRAIDEVNDQVALASFDDLTAVGTLQEFSRTETDRNIFLLPEMTSFTVTGDVVPEPASAMLILVGTTFMATRRRRR